MIGLAQTIESGQAPSEGQVIAGLAAAGTMITGNPIAGAALAAAGGVIGTFQTALQNFFQAVGWIQPPDPAVTLVGLRLPGSPLPADASSPIWWHIRSVNDLQSILTQVNTGQGAIYNVDAENYLNNALQALKTPGSYPSWCYANPNAFEQFFLPMLVADLERWANGAGFMMPRDLLAAAAQSWNSTHSSSQTMTYSPVDRGVPQYDCFSPVAQLLGSGGDLKPSASYQADPLIINTGPSTVPSTSGSTIGKAAKHAAVVAGGGVAAGLLYAWVTGKAIDAVFGNAWGTLSRWTADAVHAVEGKGFVAERPRKRRRTR